MIYKGFLIKKPKAIFCRSKSLLSWPKATCDVTHDIKMTSQVAFGHDKSGKLGRRNFYKKALYDL